ncbi:RNA polymerase sigma factor [Agromyces subbeticus]|uniref:RNA polymerase sigma factor n=1 Tax=Agromyces subbeticus TaxID=293890 RepID=UPI0003B66D9A|nr:sigma-70 family RNA polymerase sigma factor [Agromyces subbeticus]
MPGARDTTVEHLLRSEAPQVLGAIVRRFGRFDVAEDAVQEALIAASRQWPADGVPAEPRSWLIRVAYRKMIDLLRSEQAAHRREAEAAASDPSLVDPTTPGPTVVDHDDSLHLLVLCCHPALRAASQIALTLRAVGGLTTAEIAHAYGVSEPTMAVRISRAKQQLKKAGARFALPLEGDLRPRIEAVMRVLYLVFNEGYTATSGDTLARRDLTEEAIRLARLLQRMLPDDPEPQGLTALMLLTEARRGARTDASGELVPMAEQDRGRWDAALIAEGSALIERAWRQRSVGTYQLQAAIAAVHAEAVDAAETDWPQIAALYLGLEQLEPTAPVRLGRVVAVAHAYGAQRGLALLDDLDRQHDLSADALVSARVRAVRAHLLGLTGDHGLASTEFRAAAEMTGNLIEQRYLHERAVRMEVRSLHD